MAALRVLVADDSRIFRSLVRQVLEERGVEVLEAGDGKQALDTALARRPDALILDALMPQLSGFDVLGKLREKLPEYRPKVFLVTAVYKSRRWEAEAKAAYQVDEYLEKPVEPDQLLALLGKHFTQIGGSAS